MPETETHELYEGAPLSEVFDYADGLTKERNSKHLPTPAHRILHLSRGGAEMAKAVIVGDLKVIPLIASKMLLRVWGVVESIDAKDDFIRALAAKYPENGCSYCGHKPCVCGTEKANDSITQEPTEAQLSWSIAKWQSHFKDVYGSKNDALTLEAITLKLNAEIGEVAEAGLMTERANASVNGLKYREQILLELVDCFAWIVGIMNHQRVAQNLEVAFIARYGNGCPNCKEYPCVCGEFTYIDERKDPRNKK